MNKCKFLYDGKCNKTNLPCWYSLAEIEVCCENYQEDNYRENPDKERDGRNEEFA